MTRSQGGRWLRRLLAFAAVVAVVWLGGWLWHRRSPLAIPFAVVAVFVAAVGLVSSSRSRHSALAERARRREEIFWRSVVSKDLGARHQRDAESPADGGRS